jgi:hypothetical protein
VSVSKGIKSRDSDQSLFTKFRATLLTVMKKWEQPKGSSVLSLVPSEVMTLGGVEALRKWRVVGSD